MIAVLLLLCALIVAVFTAVPLLRRQRWWVRMFDFPRVQVACLALLVLLALPFWGPQDGWLWVGIALAGFALVGQVVQILPYTPLWPKESVDAEGDEPTLKIMIANVQMDNRQSKGLVDFIEAELPDLIVVDEADDWWAETLSIIEDRYPHTLKSPQSNTYGMLLYSRRQLLHAEKRCILDPDIPSMHVCVPVDGRKVGLHLIHPAPPYPKWAKTTLGRDAELLVVGRLTRQQEGPLIVAGDLNDVAWSHTTRLFQRVSRMLDPRRGRGMFNTFHARHWWARWPLDHLFHTAHFRLVRIERGPCYGSDHFPMLIELELDPSALDEHSAPPLEPEHRAEANEKVARAGSADDPNN